MKGSYSPDTVPAEFTTRQDRNWHVLTDILLFLAMIIIAGILTRIKAR